MAWWRSVALAFATVMLLVVWSPSAHAVTFYPPVLERWFSPTNQSNPDSPYLYLDANSSAYVVFNATNMTSNWPANNYAYAYFSLKCNDATYPPGTYFTVTWLKDAVINETTTYNDLPGDDGNGMVIYYTYAPWGQPVGAQADMAAHLVFRYASAASRPGGGLMVFKLSLSSGTMHCATSQQAGSVVYFSVTAAGLFGPYANCRDCLHTNLGRLPRTGAWCRNLTMQYGGWCGDGTVEAGMSYGQTCAAEDLFTTSCPPDQPWVQLLPARNSSWVANYNSTAAYLVVNQQPAYAGNGLFALTNAAMSQYAAAFISFDLSQINASTTNIYITWDALDYFAGLNLNFMLVNETRYKMPTTFGEIPPVSDVYLHDQQQSSNYVGYVNLVDLSWAAKYHDPNMMLMLNTTDVSGYYRLAMYGHRAPLECMRPALYIDPGPYSGYYLGLQLTSILAATSCGSCLATCINYLGACGWCSTGAGQCMEGVKFSRTCVAADWHYMSCPSPTNHTRLTADWNKAFSIINVNDPTEYYGMPATDDVNVQTEYILSYYHFNISSLVGRNISTARLTVTKPAPSGFQVHRAAWALMPGPNFTVNDVDYFSKRSVPNIYLNAGQAGNAYIQRMQFYQIDVGAYLASALHQGFTEAWFCLVSYDANEMWSNVGYDYFPTAQPRLDVIMATGPNFDLSGLKNCSACFLNCPAMWLMCGWCSTTSRCLEGDATGPYSDSCAADAWMVNRCPVDAIPSPGALYTTEAIDSIYVRNNNPDKNFYHRPWLVMNYQVTYTTVYLKFNISSFRGVPFTDITLRIYSGGGTPEFPFNCITTVYAMQMDNNEWEGSNVTFNHPPYFKRRRSAVMSTYGCRPGYDQALLFPSQRYSYLFNSILSTMARVVADPNSNDIVSFAVSALSNTYSVYGHAQPSTTIQFKPQLVLTNDGPKPWQALITCVQCINSPATPYGWCDSARKCMLGDVAGPAFEHCAGTKAWFFTGCPYEYFRAQPYNHTDFIRPELDVSFNATGAVQATPFTSSNDARVVINALPPALPVGFKNPPELLVWFQGAIKTGVVWNLVNTTRLSPSAITSAQVLLRCSQTFLEPSDDYGDQFTLFALNLTRYQQATFSWLNVTGQLNNNAGAAFANRDAQVVVDVTSSFTNPNGTDVYNNRFGVSIQGDRNVMWLGSRAQNIPRAEQTLRITGSLYLQPENCAAFTNPCTCVIGGTCGWCISGGRGYCTTGVEAGLCQSGNLTAGSVLYAYSTTCPTNTFGKYGFYVEGTPVIEDCQCGECPAGQYGLAVAQICAPCPPGSYSDVAGALACTPCAVGTWQQAAGQTSCQPCPVGAQCEVAGLANPGTLLPGYAGCCSPGGIKACTVPSACIGGNCSCSGSFCAEGYVGDYCDSCQSDPQFYRNDGLCERCPEAAPFLIILALIFVVALCALLLKYGKTISHYLISLSIGLSFTQAVGLFKYFNFRIPAEVIKLVDAFAATNLSPDVFNAECVFKGVTFYSIFALRLCLPLLVAVIFFTFYEVVKLHTIIVQRCVVGFRTRHQRFVRDRDMRLTGCAKVKEWFRWQAVRFTTHYMTKIELSLYKSRIINAFLTFLCLSYLFTAETALKAFACTTGDTGTFLVYDPAIPCVGELYGAVQTGAIVALVFYTAGLPIAFLAILLSNRVYIQLGDEKFLARYGMLFSRYKANRFYWELVIMARKFIIVVCAVFAPVVKPSYVTAVILIFVFIGTIVAQSFGLPFKYGQHNFLEVALMGNYLLALIAGAAGSTGNTTTMSGFLFFFFVLGLMMLLVVLAYDVSRALRVLVERNPKVKRMLVRCGWLLGTDEEKGAAASAAVELNAMDSVGRAGLDSTSGATSNRAFDSRNLPPTPPQKAAATAAPTVAATASATATPTTPPPTPAATESGAAPAAKKNPFAK